jgi:muramoyltetrapeptide carboxypeptidase
MSHPLKPPALRPGDAIRILSLSSPVQEDRLERGLDELTRLGYEPRFDRDSLLARHGFFAGSPDSRLAALKQALAEPDTRAIVFTRGGYGANYLLDCLPNRPIERPKILLGYSDLSSLQIFLWQSFGLVTFYGPMVAAGFDHGPSAPKGYDPDSLASALAGAARWTLGLQGESLVSGEAEGLLLGGCLTLVETTLGTPWELDTTGAILALEDRGMKPWQVDRALMHLKQAGKLRRIRGIILGDFPECQGPPGSESARDVAQRILAPLGIPVVWGAPIGHTERSILTLPLGVQAKLKGGSSQQELEVLEPSCV